MIKVEKTHNIYLIVLFILTITIFNNNSIFAKNNNIAPKATLSFNSSTRINPSKIIIKAVDSFGYNSKMSYTIKDNSGNLIISKFNISGPVNIRSDIKIDGTYIINLFATDKNNNKSDVLTDTIIIDTTPPNITIDVNPTTSNPSYARIRVFDEIDEKPVVKYKVKRNSKLIQHKSTDIIPIAGINVLHNISGKYTIEAHASDSYGNTSIIETENYEVDSSTPTSIITIEPTINNPNKIILSSLGKNNNIKLSYKLFNIQGDLIDYKDNLINPYNDILSKIKKDGMYTIELTSKNSKGVISPVLTKSFRIDRVKPKIKTNAKAHSIKAGSILPSDIKQLFNISASDSLDGEIPSSAINITESINTTKAGLYPIQISVNDIAGNKTITKVNLKIEEVNVTGIAFEDNDYDSINNGIKKLKNLKVELINKDTNESYSSTTTDKDGKFTLSIPYKSKDRIRYAIKPAIKKDYVLADKIDTYSGSKIDPVSGVSNEINIDGSDYTNINIGQAKNANLDTESTTHTIYANGNKKANINLKNGQLKTLKYNSNIIKVNTYNSSLNIVGINKGTTKLNATFTNKYKYQSDNIEKSIVIKVLPVPLIKFKGNESTIIADKNENNNESIFKTNEINAKETQKPEELATIKNTDNSDDSKIELPNVGNEFLYISLVLGCISFASCIIKVKTKR